VLTRQGIATLVVAVGIVVVGRLFGVMELYLVGAAVAALVVVALLYVRFASLRLRIGRSVTPSRVHAGDATRVEVSATNVNPRRSPLIKLRDPVGGTRGALLHLAPLAGGATARAAYRLPTSRRGLVPIGPLTVEVNDPFGLARRRAEAAPVLDLMVYPHVEPLPTMQAGGDRDPHGMTIRANTLGHQGDDFYALRQYVMGDDLRRVHWPSTARKDDLMVRQEEMPWQDRTTVLFDVRRSAHASPASFERAVTTAASVVASTFRDRHVLRLFASDGTDSTAGAGLAHVEAIMDYLAVVEPAPHGSLRESVERIYRARLAGSFVVVLGRAPAGEIEVVSRLFRTFRSTIVVVHDPPLPLTTGRGVRVIDATTEGGLAQRWIEATKRAVPA
jgi:uncharacterized protein (DUF58 family)